MKTFRALVFGSIGLLLLPALARTQDTPDCGTGSTLKDSLSLQDTQRAEQFLIALRSALDANDRTKIAAMVKYPVRVNLPNGAHEMIASPRQLTARFDSVFNAKTRAAIRGQVPACMFARDQGVMIGNGEIWFQDFGGIFRIWSFNRM